MSKRKRSFDPTLRGNPHQLTINQHIHTAYCISEFEAADHCVEVRRLSSDKTFRVTSDNPIFCTKRCWDERAEKGYMAAIERAFHAEVKRASISSTSTVSSRDHEAISRYHLLWGLRHIYGKNPPPDTALVGVSGSGLTKEQEENAESKGVSFVRADGLVPSRFFISLKIQQRIDRHMVQYKGTRWGLLRADRGEFLVADCYGGLTVMPITPNLCFCAGVDDGVIGWNDVMAINTKSRDVASEFYFGRELSLCPFPT